MMESDPPNKTRQAAIDKIAADISDMERRIQEKRAAKERTAALIRSLEEKAASEKEGGNKVAAATTSQPERETPEQREEGRTEVPRQTEGDVKRQKVEALERDKKENPFKYFVIKNMHDTAFACIYSKTKATATLEDINSKAEKSGREVKFWNFKKPDTVKHYTTFFSSNGFTLQLQNPNEVRDPKGDIDIRSPKARYRIVYPNWTHSAGSDSEQTLDNGETLLRKKAEAYQREQLALFEEESQGA